MAEQTAAQEPTMEEILASIRRIISEDEPAASAAPAAASETRDDVLELTERIGADAADEEVDDFAPPPVASAPPPLETSGDLEIFAKPEPAPAPRPAPPPPVMHDDDDSLISAPTAAHVTSAFSQLTLSRNTPMPEPGRGLEDVVRELLRPMLKDWLDQNLPAIVEARVQAEVERLSRRV
jgi:uncharacterized protein